MNQDVIRAILRCVDSHLRANGRLAVQDSLIVENYIKTVVGEENVINEDNEQGKEGDSDGK